jgi:hypothetical protein
MGNSQSQVANIVNNSSMSVVNDFVSQNIAQTSAINNNTQTFTLNIGVIDHCPLSLNQTIQASTVTVATVSDTQTKNLATTLDSKLQDALKQSTDMVNGVASLTGGNSSDVSTNISNTIKQSISNRISSTNINTVAASSVNMQTMTLNIAACQYSPIQANQGIISNVIAQNILTQISTDIANSTVISTAANSSDQTSTMKNQGLNDLVDSIFKGLTGIWGIVAAIVCCLCIGVLAFALSPAGQQATVIGAQAGANSLGKMP